MHLIDIVRKFIRAERLGDWHLHISTLQEMLPLFAACRHNNYTKSVWLYLQQMSTLETNYPNLFKKYIDGNHILRRNNFKCWGGIHIDQGIKQTLMRDLKFEVGLTRGRGFNSVQRNLFVFLRPLCAEVTDAIEKLSSCSFVPSTEMKEGSGNSRMVRDNDFHKKLQDFLKKFSSFKVSDSPDSVRNIATGVHGSSKVNVDTEITVGFNILSNMLTKNVADYHFKTSLQTVNLLQKIRISDKDGSVSIDRNLLFQRLTAILLSGKNNDNQTN